MSFPRKIIAPSLIPFFLIGLFFFSSFSYAKINPATKDSLQGYYDRLTETYKNTADEDERGNVEMNRLLVEHQLDGYRKYDDLHKQLRFFVPRAALEVDNDLIIDYIQPFYDAFMAIDVADHLDQLILKNPYRIADSFFEKERKLDRGIQLVQRQFDVHDAYLKVEDRIRALPILDPRRNKADALLEKAKTAYVDFLSLAARYSLEAIIDKEANLTDVFKEKERLAAQTINALNLYLFSPVKPSGNVPEGDLIDDFIPGLIRTLFRFASFTVLVAFVVSAGFFMASLGNDERITKAKRILYYTLIGFAFVVLAFAIVKAITDIDFFGFI